ncbi:hypothetical protein C8J57DRAFT_1528763 [Mycena rebaudengoi]|nr:hypothetical protein C8J57DRAFT_1528763 [Mycena rebaudengoi]
MPKAEIYRPKSFWADMHKARAKAKARRENPLDEGIFGGEAPLVTFVPGHIAPIIHVHNGNKTYPSSDSQTTRPFTRYYPPVLTPSSVHACGASRMTHVSENAAQCLSIPGKPRKKVAGGHKEDKVGAQGGHTHGGEVVGSAPAHSGQQY